MKSIRRKGFTLVELLIVIVVIGILAAMMMLSSTEAVSSAKATKIIADMRNIKTSVLEWYTDNYDRVFKDSKGEYKIYLNSDKTGDAKYIGDFLITNKDEMLKYFEGSGAIVFNPHNSLSGWSNSHATGSYFLCSETYGEVTNKQNEDGSYGQDRSSGIKLTGNAWYVGYCFGKSEGDIKAKVAARAASIGLVGGQQKVVNQIFDASKGNFVYMMIMPLD